MIEEGLRYLKSLGGQPPTDELHSTEEKIYYPVWKNGSYEIIDLPMPKPTREHYFTTLQGFMEYLNSAHCKDDNGVLFVQEKCVEANLAYKTNEHQRAELILKHSEEFFALKRLGEGLDQKSLWTELITRLHGCLSEQLLMAIGAVKVSVSNQESVRIDVAGTSEGKKQSTVVIRYEDAKGKDGEKENQIPLEWKWKGRIWEAFDQEYEITLRLEVKNDNGLKFVFHPRRLQTVLQTARLDLADKIAATLPPQFTVHEGSL